MLSVVVPVFNEEEVLPNTHRELTGILKDIGEPYEIVYVNDGSVDTSIDILKGLQTDDPHVSVISFSRNFGHEIANAAGLHFSRGDAVVLIDADLQDPPELIPEMVAKWREGYHVVYGVRRTRRGETMMKRLTAHLFYSLISKIADVKIPRNVGDFRLMDRQVVEVFRRMREYHPFFRGMIAWCGYQQTGIEFDRRPRTMGSSKYPYFRLTKLAFDTITSFSTLPLRMLTYLAFFVLAVSTGGLLISILIHFLSSPVESAWWVLSVSGILNGLVLSSVALIGEYVLRMHAQTQQRPLYVIDDVYGPIAEDDRVAEPSSGVWPRKNS
jgi:dolichol-phosphate mannosyltransferase